MFCWSILSVNNLEEQQVQSGAGVEIAFSGSDKTKKELLCDGQSRKTSVGSSISF